jgi:hypothetical protein
VPLFQRGTAEVARLTEMAADDAAARASGRTTVVAALLAIGTGVAVPAAALSIPGAGLAAAAYAVPARVERMLRPPQPASDAALAVALGAVLLLLNLLPAALTVLAG